MRLLLLLAALMALAEPRVWSPRTPAQQEAMNSLAPECAYMGRRFGGKSNVACVKGYRYANTYPGAHVGICRLEHAMLTDSVRITMEEEVVPPDVWAACWNESDSMLYLPNGSFIHLFGVKEVGRRLGARYAFIAVDQAEQISRAQMNVLNSGLTQVGMPWKQLLLLFNPGGRSHWAFKRYRPDYGAGERRDARGKFADVILVHPDDFMDLLTPEDKDRLERLEGHWYQRLRMGKWVDATGQVFARFDPEIHIVRPGHPAWPAAWDRWGGLPPPDWPRIRAIDVGYYPDPYCVQWWAVSPEQRFYRYREDYALRQDPAQKAARINQAEAEELARLRETLARMKQRGELEDRQWRYLNGFTERLNLVGSFADHDSGERALLANHGISTGPAEKEIDGRIRHIQALMNPEQPGGPRLFLVQGALIETDQELLREEAPTCLEDEIGDYIWRKRNDEAESVGSSDKPRQVRDHACDTMCYALYTYELHGQLEVV